jgi:hypothetical protein
MEPEDPRERDIQDVLSEERGRGTRRKHVDSEERRKQARLRSGVLAAIRNRDEARLVSVLREGEILDGTPEFEKILKTFREIVGRRRPK